MNILILSPFLPYPPDTGAKIRTFHIIRSLHGHNITLFAFSNVDVDHALQELKRYCSAIYIFPYPRVSYKNVLMNLFSLKPFLALRLLDTDIINKINEIAGAIDVVIFESLLMAEYRSALTNQYKILDELNLEFVRAHRRTKSTPNILKKILSYIIFCRLKRYELKTITNFELILVCSDHDQRIIKKYHPNKQVAVLPNVVDTDYFCPTRKTPSRNKIIFLGTMWYEPNADAIKFFIQDVFPLIKKEIEDIELIVIGEDSSKKIRKLSSDGNVRIIDYVDDIRPYFEDSKLFVAPIRMGSGTRLKILTAMAMGLPVVSTRIGCEGLDVLNGKNIIIADEPFEMKENIVRILRDENLRQWIAKNGRELVEGKYSLKTFVIHLNVIFDAIITKKLKWKN